MFVEVIRALPRSIFFPGTRFPDTLGSINNSDLCENSSLHDTQAPPTRNWQLPHGGFSGNNFQPCKLTNEVAVSTLDRPRLKRGLTSSDRSSATKPKTFRRNYDNLDSKISASKKIPRLSFVFWKIFFSSHPIAISNPICKELMITTECSWKRFCEHIFRRFDFKRIKQKWT